MTDKKEMVPRKALEYLGEKIKNPFIVCLIELVNCYFGFAPPLIGTTMAVLANRIAEARKSRLRMFFKGLEDTKVRIMRS